MDPIGNTVLSQGSSTSSATLCLESDTESATLGLSSEIFRSASSEELCTDSMREYEEYAGDAPTEWTTDLSPMGGESAVSIAEMCTFVSDSSAKRYKSGSSSISVENDTQVFTGFKTGRDKRIYIDQQRVQEAAAEVEKSVYAADFIEDLLSSLTDCDGVLECCEDQEVPSGRVVFENAKAHGTEEMIESGFTTGRSKPILISRDRIDQLQSEPQLVESGFTTGRSKPILINKAKLTDILESTQTTDLMTDVYHKVTTHFKKEERGWIFENFKWSWLHLYLNNEIDGFTNEELSAKVIEVMALKKRHERSILRRIVEFDDTSFRFMALGVIDYCNEWVELFDGFYSLRFEIDQNIYAFLKKHRCELGTKLLVFGSELLIKEATSIFDIRRIPLKLCYNGLKMARADAKLGRAREVSFLNTISAIRPDGGVVSGLIVKISQIIEQKYLVVVENYRNRVDDLESELEKIYRIAERTGHQITTQDIAVRPYCKVVVDDGTGLCVLTWWSPPVLRVGEKYMFVCLNAVEWSGRLELATSRKTYHCLVK